MCVCVSTCTCAHDTSIQSTTSLIWEISVQDYYPQKQPFELILSQYIQLTSLESISMKSILILSSTSLPIAQSCKVYQAKLHTFLLPPSNFNTHKAVIFLIHYNTKNFRLHFTELYSLNRSQHT